VTAIDPNFSLPNWRIPSAPPPANSSDDAYLEWLVENRAELIRQNLLEKLQNDPVRQPVNARFVL
jgi:hypothetical protein